jgi:flagellar hook assembly protein FlgD
VNTSFAISVPRSQHVELGVYDVRGALVKTLVRGTIAPGRHVAAWDGRDGAGRPVAKGVYLVRLATRDFQTSAKAVYLGER